MENTILISTHSYCLLAWWKLYIKWKLTYLLLYAIWMCSKRKSFWNKILFSFLILLMEKHTSTHRGQKFIFPFSICMYMNVVMCVCVYALGKWKKKKKWKYWWKYILTLKNCLSINLVNMNVTRVIDILYRILTNFCGTSGSSLKEYNILYYYFTHNVILHILAFVYQSLKSWSSVHINHICLPKRNKSASNIIRLDNLDIM